MSCSVLISRRRRRCGGGCLAPESLEAAAGPFKALTDATRVAVLLSLADGGSCCVCDLSWIVGRDEKLVSHHVRLLKQLGAARSRRDGRMVMYELTDLGAALVAAYRELGQVMA